MFLSKCIALESLVFLAFQDPEAKESKENQYAGSSEKEHGHEFLKRDKQNRSYSDDEINNKKENQCMYSLVHV
jgi:hypothetical protein